MMDNIKMMKQLYHIIGPVLLKLLPKTYRADPNRPLLKKILVIRPGGHGLLTACKIVMQKQNECCTKL